MKFNPREIQKIQDIAKDKAQFTISTSLIAGLLFAFNPQLDVQAESLDEDPMDEPLTIQTIYDEYHSLLTDSSPMEADVEAKEESETNPFDEYSFEAIKNRLIEILPRTEHQETIEQLESEDLTVEELKDILDILLGRETPSETETEKEKDSPLPAESAEEPAEEAVAPAENVTSTQDTSATAEHQAENSTSIEAPEPVNLPVEKAKPANAVQVTLTNSQMNTYVVQAGDTLNKIASNFGTTAKELAVLNNISNMHQIRVGQKLTIHAGEANLEELAKPHSQADFIEILGEYATTVAKEQNLYASVMIAQAALETGFGQSSLSANPNYNLYGMKGSYQGNSVLMATKEYSASKGWYTIQAHFKKYPSYLESLLDHAAYIRRGPSWAPNYYAGVWLENTSSYRDATAALQGRYATDPNYASKLNAIIERYGLTRFDFTGGMPEESPETPPVTDTEVNKPVTPSTGDQTSTSSQTISYTIKRGDTLSHIARNYQMTVRELKNLNNLTSDLIFVGQQIQVKEVEKPVLKPTPVPKPEPQPESKPESKPSATESQSYTVKRGDTLFHIARVYKMTVRELKELNGLQSDLIVVGQNLQVKTETVTIPKPEVKPSQPTTSTATTYIVKRGDTLSHIARAHNMTVSALKTLNNLKSDLIFVNQQLKLKSTAATTQPTNRPSRHYVVKRGDTLYQIALRNGSTVQAIKAKNNLQSDLIFVGQQLQL